jgi:hypothetical protein
VIICPYYRTETADTGVLLLLSLPYLLLLLLLLLLLPFFAPSALVFAHIGPMDVGLAVFTGRLGHLADHIVPCGPKQAARSKEAWVQELKRRLQPCTRKPKTC